MTKLADLEVEKLIKIADANIKEWKRNWYTLFIPIPRRYNLEEQLEAIERLGNSESEKALEYLSNLSEKSYYKYTRYYSHINLKGELRSRMNESYNSIDFNFRPVYLIFEDEYFKMKEIIESAKSNLEKALNLN